MEFTDFMQMRKGYNSKLIYEQQIFRRMTMIIASAFAGGDKIKPEKLWPLPTDSGHEQVKARQYANEMVEWKGQMLNRWQVEKIKEAIIRNHGLEEGKKRIERAMTKVN